MIKVIEDWQDVNKGYFRCLMCGVMIYHKYTIVTFIYRCNLYYNMEQVKFITKVSTMGDNRYLIFFPKEYVKDGKRLKGKHVRVILEEMSP